VRGGFDALALHLDEHPMVSAEEAARNYQTMVAPF